MLKEECLIGWEMLIMMKNHDNYKQITAVLTRKFTMFDNI